VVEVEVEVGVEVGAAAVLEVGLNRGMAQSWWHPW